MTGVNDDLELQLMSNIDAEVEKEKIETKVAEKEKTDDNSTQFQVISISTRFVKYLFVAWAAKKSDDMQY